MKLLMFGGTFNPVHIGHLFIAEEARVSLGYDKVIFVPAYKPAHKQIVSGVLPEDRLNMLSLAIKNNEFFSVDDCEITRRGVSYTLDTIDYLYNRFSPEGKLGLLIGDDLVPGFSTWKKADVLPELVDIVIARRTSESPYKVEWRHRYITNTIIHVSSSDIRNRVAENRAFRYLVPYEVYEYISKKGLYHVDKTSS
ncbi:nicotinate (nicotinamide) nucleotide adenylyltransferase [Spirochaetia bacterium 38H-sp]|uniref:Probable nicotinate-nucleotide adenylyltransferase n=1 Tax=Rarispira pelagica TaxID=3141764 RepID=A0ABU9UE00_9SPIR